jgi:Putative prokaryotic signal transducing protein
MADNIITVAEYANFMQAEMAKQVLEDFGIQAMVVKQNATDIWLPTNLPMTAKLQVLESNSAKAKEILKEQKSSGIR